MGAKIAEPDRAPRGPFLRPKLDFAQATEVLIRENGFGERGATASWRRRNCRSSPQQCAIESDVTRPNLAAMLASRMMLAAHIPRADLTIRAARPVCSTRAIPPTPRPFRILSATRAPFPATGSRSLRRTGRSRSSDPLCTAVVPVVGGAGVPLSERSFGPPFPTRSEIAVVLRPLPYQQSARISARAFRRTDALPPIVPI